MPLRVSASDACKPDTLCNMVYKSFMVVIYKCKGIRWQELNPYFPALPIERPWPAADHSTEQYNVIK
jgi:hypothetical protein